MPPKMGFFPGGGAGRGAGKIAGVDVPWEVDHDLKIDHKPSELFPVSGIRWFRPSLLHAASCDTSTAAELATWLLPAPYLSTVFSAQTITPDNNMRIHHGHFKTSQKKPERKADVPPAQACSHRSPSPSL